MYDIATLNDKLVSELRQIAKDLNINNYEELRKQELISNIVDKTKKTSDASIIYSANVSFIVDSWLHNVNINEGFVLRSPTENSTVNKLVFYSSYEVDVKKRPKLFITYSKK